MVSVGGGGNVADLGTFEGDGGVYTLRSGGGGEEVELDLLEGTRCNGGTLPSTEPVCLRCSTTSELTYVSQVARPFKDSVDSRSFLTLSVMAAMSSGETPSALGSEGSAVLPLVGGTGRELPFVSAEGLRTEEPRASVGLKYCSRSAFMEFG